MAFIHILFAINAKLSVVAYIPLVCSITFFSTNFIPILSHYFRHLGWLLLLIDLLGKTMSTSDKQFD